MIGALVALLSLNLTLSLVNSNIVAKTLNVVAATATTPIVITLDAPHGYVRPAHAVVSALGGMPEATGLWVLTPSSPTAMTLTTYDAQGNRVNSIGTGTYTSGGIAQVAFPDGSILLGRRNVDLSTGPASPRVVFIPVDGRKWGFESYGGQGGAPPLSRGSAEQQAQKLQPQLGTQFPTFEVHVSASAPSLGYANPDPDYGDFDATQFVVWSLFAVLFDTLGPARAQVLHESWPSQSAESGTMTQRGQKWVGVLELQQAVVRPIPQLQFAPVNVSAEITVKPQDDAVPGDATVIVIPSP